MVPTKSVPRDESADTHTLYVSVETRSVRRSDRDTMLRDIYGGR